MSTPENSCKYEGRRDEVIVSVLYDEADAGERAAFEAHAALCAACRRELAQLREVRDELGEWAPPQPAGALTTWSSGAAGAKVVAMPPGAEARRSRWAPLREMPGWAQFAAAILVLGIAAGIANIQIIYSEAGVSVRTGWASAPQDAVPRDSDTAAATATQAPWRTELAALEQQLRREWTQTTGARQPATTGNSDDVLRQVRRLLEESERRQQRELALRVAEVTNEVQAQRQADLVRIDRSQRALQRETGMEVLRNREMLSNLVRTSQRQ
jgi:hypothetical protein